MTFPLARSITQIPRKFFTFREARFHNDREKLSSPCTSPSGPQLARCLFQFSECRFQRGAMTQKAR